MMYAYCTRTKNYIHFASQGFLLLENQKTNENENIKISIPEKTDALIEASIKMENVDASWTGDKLNLNKINLNFKGDQLIMVVGQVGCGKVISFNNEKNYVKKLYILKLSELPQTTLLHALLAELRITGGNCQIYGRTAYSSQEPCKLKEII